MVKEEKISGNPIASVIDKLHLERNCVTLLLSNNLDKMDNDEKTLPVDKVRIVKVSNVSLAATEQDIQEFFSLCDFVYT
ncbi:hypothetical protein ACS0TY_031192 [Phlomoides rotata]